MDVKKDEFPDADAALSGESSPVSETPASSAEDKKILAELLAKSGHADVSPDAFQQYGSARTLYHFHVDNAGAY